MSESSNQPTRKSDPPPTPYEGETHDAPMPPEPGTVSAVTHSGTGEPHTASMPPAGAGATEPFAEPPGFVVIRELGSGGMGVVYEARQTRLNRPVALKVLRGGRSNAQDVIRFLREAEAVAAIKHPHVVQVYEFGQHSGGPFMALELLTGGTLSDRLRSRGRMDPRDAAALVATLAEAVQAAHDLGIVHRDLKPGNVLFDAAGVPKVTDFGLAKRGTAELTRTQALMGTPAYMAPEQARGDSKFVGPPADVWALGAILYECLTGKRAFDSEDTWAVLRKVTDEAPPAPRTHVPGLPHDLELIALKCLEKTPADRYPSAAALAADLENYLAGRPVSVRPAGPVERLVKWAKRNKAIAGAVAAVFLALVVGAAVSLAFALEAQKQSQEVAKANGELTQTNDNLTRSRDDLAQAKGELQSMVVGINKSRHDLLKFAGDLEQANEAAAERGYLSDIALAHQLWKANDLRGMRAALDRCPPNRRRWEWRYLDRLSRPERAVYSLDSPALAVAYSPDGKALAFLTLSGTLSAFDTTAIRGLLGTQLDARGGRNRALAFRPDGKELAVACGDRMYFVDTTAVEWKANEFTPKKAGDRHGYVALGYAKGGRLLGANVENDAKTRETKISIRDVRTGAVVSTLGAWKAQVGVIVELAGAAFSPDGTRFAAAGVDSGIRVGNAKEEPAKFEPFQPTVMVWEVESNKLLGRTRCGASLFGEVAFSRDGELLGFGRRGSAAAFPPLTWLLDDPPRPVGGHAGEVMAVAFDKNGLLWSGGEDKIVRAHEVWSDAERFALRGCPQGVLRLAVSPDGKEVAAAAGDITGGGVVVRFDVDRLGRDVWRAPVTPDRVSLVTALAADGSRFAATDFSIAEGGETSRLTIRTTDGGFERVTKALGMPLVAAVRPGGLALLDRGNWLRLTDAVGETVKDIQLPDDLGRVAFPTLACTPDGKTVAVVSSVRVKDRPKDGPPPSRVRFQTWNADTGKPGVAGEADLTGAVPPGLVSADAFPTAAAVDREGKRLAAVFVTGGQEAARSRMEFRGVLVVWNLADGKEVFRQLCDEQLRCVAFDPKGRVVAGGGTASGGVVFGWDTATGKKELTLIGHTRPVLALAFGPNGRLATGGLDRIVKVWDTASGREILSLDGFAREVTRLAFTADGKNLVAATGLDLLTMMLAGGLPSEFPAAEVRTFRGPK